MSTVITIAAVIGTMWLCWKRPTARFIWWTVVLVGNVVTPDGSLFDSALTAFLAVAWFTEWLRWAHRTGRTRLVGLLLSVALDLPLKDISVHTPAERTGP